MERIVMLIGRKKILAWCQFFSIWAMNQCNTNQNLSKLFCGYWQTDSKLHLETQTTQGSKQNNEEEQSWRTDTIQI